MKRTPATAKPVFAIVTAAFAIANGTPASAKATFAGVKATFASVKAAFAIAKQVPALAKGVPAIGRRILHPKKSTPATLGFIANRAEWIPARNPEGSATVNATFQGSTDL